MVQWLRLCAGLPWWLSGKESICHCRSRGFDPWPGKTPLAEGQLRPCNTATEPVLWSHTLQPVKPVGPRARTPQQKKPPQWETHTAQLGRSPQKQWRFSISQRYIHNYLKKRFCASNAGGIGLTPCRGTSILHAMWAKKKKREKKVEALSNISNGLRKGIKSCKFGKEVIDQLCIRSQDLELFLHTLATQDTWKTSWNKEATACLLGEEVRHGCAVLHAAAGMGGRRLSQEDFHRSLRLEQGKKTEGKFKDAETWKRRGYPWGWGNSPVKSWGYLLKSDEPGDKQ